MSHHASGPDFGFPHGDARLDLTDLYVFAKPGDPQKSIIIFNVHMSMAVNPLGPTTREPFAPGALYEIKVDTDGDAIADLCYGESSPLLRMARRPRQFGGSMGPERSARATTAKSSSSKQRSQLGAKP